MALVTIRTGLAAGLAALALAPALGACSDPPASNYRPPELGVPASAEEVTGIYRTIHQGLLQLRGNGDLNLVIPTHIGATFGTFTLENGAATVRTDNCGDQVGTYTVEVLAGAGIGRSTLMFETVDDPCAVRQKFLTIDPWVYADS
ncbi:MAG: hypothetical protein QOG82_858 [Actinomycetota bacterium]|jgi:hypothetical protein|nr:hypothetical protein [Actinomycetota bacterium]